MYFWEVVFNPWGKDTFSSDEVSCTVMQIYLIAFQEKYNFRNSTVYCKKKKKSGKNKQIYL